MKIALIMQCRHKLFLPCKECCLDMAGILSHIIITTSLQVFIILCGIYRFAQFLYPSVFYAAVLIQPLNLKHTYTLHFKDNKIIKNVKLRTYYDFP